MSLDDPTSKMSKSNPNEKSRICILDDPNKVKKAIMSATTDSEGVIRYSIKEKPGISNLLDMYSAFSGKSVAKLVKEYEGHGYGDLKKDLVEVVNESLDPIRERYKEIRASKELVEALREGAEKAEERKSERRPFRLSRSHGI